MPSHYPNSALLSPELAEKALSGREMAREEHRGEGVHRHAAPPPASPQPNWCSLCTAESQVYFVDLSKPFFFFAKQI
jgi:hypothetical protein